MTPPISLETLNSFVTSTGPNQITLETTSVCNLRCVMCPQAIGAVHRPKHMEMAIYEKLRGALAEATYLQLHGIGEPLLSAAFWRYLDELAGQSGKQIRFNTNMTYLTDPQIETILRADVTGISVSLDAAKPETYRKIRNFDLNTVLSNIKRLVAARNGRGLVRPRIQINMTLMRENIEDLPDFIRLGKSLGVDQVGFWHMNEGPDWVVERPEWTFDYAAQHLGNAPALSNRIIREAMELAHQLSVVLQIDKSKAVFFDEVPT